MKKNININKIMISLLFFFVISLISIYSAKTIMIDTKDNILIKQIIYYIIGIIVLILSYKYTNIILKYHYLIYLTFVFLLTILLFLGISINGSKCWFILGPFSFQPSEFMKLSLIFTISNILAKNTTRKKIKKEFFLLLKIFIILLIPSILTFLEPDTGVVIIYFIITISMILYKGINKKWYIIIGIILLLISSSFTFLYLLKKELLLKIIGNNFFYRLDRILNWKEGIGYQLENSVIAIASGGLLGFGFNKIPLYFPEASTDFIFTSFAACFGFIGTFFLIIMIIIFDTSILKIINYKTSIRNQYIIIGVFTMLLYQQIQNIGMTISLLPITGITLPFISYGGTSLLSYMFILGIVLKINNIDKKYLN